MCLVAIAPFPGSASESQASSDFDLSPLWFVVTYQPMSKDLKSCTSNRIWYPRGRRFDNRPSAYCPVYPYTVRDIQMRLLWFAIYRFYGHPTCMPANSPNSYRTSTLRSLLLPVSIPKVYIDSHPPRNHQLHLWPLLGFLPRSYCLALSQTWYILSQNHSKRAGASFWDIKVVEWRWYGR